MCYALKHSKVSQNFACRVANVAVCLFDLLEIHTKRAYFYKSNFFPFILFGSYADAMKKRFFHKLPTI